MDAFIPFSFIVIVGEKTELPASGSLLNTTWQVRYWQWEKDPREDPGAFRALLETEPVRALRARHLDLRFGADGPGGGVSADHFATVAETELMLPDGIFEFSTVSDDGVRVYLDDEEIISNWTHHAPVEDRATVAVKAGKHRIRIEHFELDGLARLSFRLRLVK